ncbi:Patulin synthase [Pseudocercospora fuligena]|uniref:Patulin synthase n=1 Tax=Pseudocercospora fuligena TaxID=685502 RepID=A0A8H6REZ1_9PEZI|nr:Patulin synthase [Pseudocercospora fuligena]
MMGSPILAFLVLIGATTGFGLSIEQRQEDNTFDYVIVGGGTAGLTLANRLSTDGSQRVAVIEAGAIYQITNPALSSTPAGDVFWAGSDPADTNPLVDWNFVTQPQAGANGRSIHYARGKCLGGSSARNFMIYQRPTVGSLQQWADAVGDSSYTWSSWLPDFKKSVSFTPPGPLRAANASAEYNAAAFQSGGPLRVSYANYASTFSSWIELALNSIGIGQAQDFNSGSLFGAQYCSSTIQPGSQKRDSSQTSFLDAASGRSNLKVYSVTKAKKILFDSNKKATGVSVVTAGIAPYTITAKKEVIVSAGAFQSPQILMVSGIGPASTLSKFNIPVLSNLAGVGQNMWDHIFFGPSYRVKLDTFTRLANDLLYVASQFAFDYSILKRGPLTNPVCDFLGWEKVPAALKNAFSASSKSDLSGFSADWPEIEYLGAPGYVGDFASLPANQPKDGYQYATILAALVAPVSRGNLTIISDNTDDLPLINPAWLTSPTDQQVAIAAYKRARAAFTSKAMQPILADTKEYFPGTDKVQTDSQILDTIRNTLQTVWHASCTCKMGKASDPMAVVDSRARVFGVTGLRVVDASSFAILPPGHPQSTIYALAEKIARHILNGD